MNLTLKSIKKHLLVILKTIFVRKFMYQINNFMYKLFLRGIGILNYENKNISGEIFFLKKYLRQKGDKEIIVLDIGANIGDYSKIVRPFSQRAKIYAFEPNPAAFRKLEENAKRYNFTAFCLGCGDKEGRFKLYNYKNCEDSSHGTFCKDVIEKIHSSFSVGTNAAIVRLDNFLTNELGIKKIDLLKIDTEGYDFNVIKGAEKLVRENAIDVIQFEFNKMNVMSRVFFKDFVVFLFNYEFYRLLPDGLVGLGEYDPVIYEIYAFQNIIAIKKGLSLCI